jgi:hypothetical protein
MTCAVDEVLVVVQRHLGVLRMRVRGEERSAPAQLTGRDSLPAAVGELPLGAEIARLAGGIGTRKRARVRLRPDGGERVDRLDLAPLEWRDVRDLVFRAALEQQFQDAV